MTLDFDNDGILDIYDTDNDNDGIPDIEDRDNGNDVDNDWGDDF